MRYMYKVFRELSSSESADKYKERFHSEFTTVLPFSIKPIDQSKVFTLYYVPTNNIMNITNEIYKNDAILNTINAELPPIAQNNYIFDCLVEELQNTNALEGVRSSKEEIIRSARLLNENKSRERFSSMIVSYQELLSGEMNEIKSPQEIREIYNHIVDDEIDEFEKPDGDLFRKDITFVQKKSGSSKVIHKGIMPEDNIIKSISAMIDFLNNSQIPALIKIAIGHYYFGYIHPFYDGNGRTSRFISSLYMKKELSDLTAISLSRGCNDYQNKYLESFEITNSIANKGELNYFIENFLQIILNEQKKMLQELKVKKEQLDNFIEKLKSNPEIEEKELYYGIMFVLGQNYFFSVSGIGLTVKDLSTIAKKSKQIIREGLKELTSRGLVKTKGKRPVIYSLNEEYIENEQSNQY